MLFEVRPQHRNVPRAFKPHPVVSHIEVHCPAVKRFDKFAGITTVIMGVQTYLRAFRIQYT